MGWQDSFQPEPSGWQASFQADADPNDVIKSYGGGIERGAAATAMVLPNLLNSAVAGPQELYRGIRDTMQGNPTDNSPLYQPFYSSEEALKMLPSSLQPHDPQTAGGQIANISGQLMGAVASGVSPKRIIMDRASDTEPARLGKILTDNNVPVSMSDVMPDNSPTKKGLDLLSDLPFSGAVAREASQQQGLNQAVAKQLGMQADSVTAPLMEKAANESGDVFKYIGQNYNISKPQTEALLNDLSAMQGKFQSLDPKSANPLSYHINDILDKVNANGEIPGPAYSEVRSDLGRLARATSDPSVEQGAYAIQKQLDNAISPSIAQDMQKVFSENRGQYRNMIALEPAVTKNVKSGDIDPASLQQGVAKIFPNYEYNDPSSLPQLTQGAQLLRPNLQSNVSSPLQILARKYGWAGDAAQLGLLGASPVLGPASRLLNPQLRSTDFNPELAKNIGRALLAAPTAMTGKQ